MPAIDLILGIFQQFGLAVIIIVEWIGMRLFQPWAFRTGLKVIRETRSLPRPPQSAGSEFGTKSGHFKIVSPQLCLFHCPAPKLRWGLRAFAQNTPRTDATQPRTFYPPAFIKGTIEWNNGEAMMHGRLSLTVTVILVYVALGFAFPFMSSFPADWKNPFLIMWTLMSSVFVLLVWRYLRGATRILSEFEANGGGEGVGEA